MNNKSIWKNSKFTIYAGGTLFNSLGNLFFDFSVPLLIYALTKSLALMGFMSILVQVPKIIFGPIVGTIVDKLDPKTVLFCSYIFQFFIVMIIPINSYFSHLSTLIILIVGFILKTADLFARTANFVIIPVLYKEQKLEANAGFSIIWTSSTITGPVIGGMILPFLQPVGLVFLDGITFLIMILFLFMVNLPHKTQTNQISKNRPLLLEVFDGFKLIFNAKKIRLFLLSVVILSLAIDPVETLTIYNLKHNFHFADSSVGYFITASGIGLFLGSLLIKYFKKNGYGHTIKMGYFLMCIGVILLIIPIWYFIPICFLLISCGSVVYVIGRSSLIQTYCPTQFLGRFNSIFQSIEQIAAPLAISISVIIANIFPMYVTFILMSIVMLISFLILIFSKIASGANLVELFDVSDVN